MGEGARVRPVLTKEVPLENLPQEVPDAAQKQRRERRVAGLSRRFSTAAIPGRAL